MRAQANREADKELLTKLSEVLQSSVERISLDDCGDWNIFGRRGHIFTDSKLWYIFVAETTKRKWSAIKAKLKFMELSQDGDDEGIMKLERMPSYEEAEAIREVIGLNKRPALTEEHRAKLVERGINLTNKGVSA